MYKIRVNALMYFEMENKWLAYKTDELCPLNAHTATHKHTHTHTLVNDQQIIQILFDCRGQKAITRSSAKGSHLLGDSRV